jgi:hypothetical protein
VAVAVAKIEPHLVLAVVVVQEGLELQLGLLSLLARL